MHIYLRFPYQYKPLRHLLTVILSTAYARQVTQDILVRHTEGNMLAVNPYVQEKYSFVDYKLMNQKAKTEQIVIFS